MKFERTLNIKNAVILVVIAGIANFILLGLVLLGIHLFYPTFPVDGLSPLIWLCSLIINLGTIIFAIQFFGVEVKNQFNKIKLKPTFLFSLLTVLIFLLILPLVNPIDFFEKIANYKITTHQYDLKVLNPPNFFNVLYFFLMVILTPIIEEILYRGIILHLFLQRYSVKISLILSSLIFAFIHFKFIGFGYLFLYGLLFGFAYYKTNSLFTSILLHFLINLMASTTSNQYIELNNTNFTKYILFIAVLLTTAFIVFNALNKGTNSINFDTKIFTKKSKTPLQEIKDKSVENE